MVVQFPVSFRCDIPGRYEIVNLSFLLWPASLARLFCALEISISYSFPFAKLVLVLQPLGHVQGILQINNSWAHRISEESLLRLTVRG